MRSSFWYKVITWFKNWLRSSFTRLTGLYVTRSRPQTEKAALQVSISDLLGLAVAVKPRGLRVIQIGAYDGISFDPVYPLLKEVPAKIVLIEPNKEAAQNLSYVYPQAESVVVVEAAIVEDDKQSEVNLYRFTDQAIAFYPDLGGCSSLSFAHVKKAFELSRSKLPENMKLNDVVITDSVPAMSANRLVFDYDLQKTDVVVIDAEGYDWVILQGLLEATLRPSLIYFESKSLDQEQSETSLWTLQSYGYSILRMGRDTAAIWNPHLVKRDALEDIK